MLGSGNFVVPNSSRVQKHHGTIIGEADRNCFSVVTGLHPMGGGHGPNNYKDTKP
jgi:hypothetical protein